MNRLDVLRNKLQILLHDVLEECSVENPSDALIEILDEIENLWKLPKSVNLPFNYKVGVFTHLVCLGFRVSFLSQHHHDCEQGEGLKTEMKLKVSVRNQLNHTYSSLMVLWLSSMSLMTASFSKLSITTCCMRKTLSKSIKLFAMLIEASRVC
jgi:hypothetical protein